ncbi:hypothetical protein ACS0TY_011395 [Phlomoides rotata]
MAGNITEIELCNFMTFNKLTCKPGSRLNLVIGPNGSGKSSLVCAIALGLGGEPQIGSHFKKALIAESVRESLHNWCKRVKERSKATNSITTRSTCSLDDTIDERDEIITVASGTLSPCSSTGSLSHPDANKVDQECGPENLNPTEHEYSFIHMQHP